MDYPIPVMKVASKVKMLHYQHVESWTSLNSLHLGDDRLDVMVSHQAANAITREFISDVMKHMCIERSQEHDGLYMRFTCVALRRQELLDLLYEAYCEGQSSALRYGPNVGVQPL